MRGVTSCLQNRSKNICSQFKFNERYIIIDLALLNSTAGLKWFEFDQNNSGGFYIENDVVGSRVFVQAPSAEEASNIAAELTEPYSEFCECCGERWWIFKTEDDGYDVPTVYQKPIVSNGRFNENALSWFGEQAVFYPYNGTPLVLTIDLIKQHNESVE